MTIFLYSGTPGSGKSYHATVDGVRKLNKKVHNKVICNYNLYFEDKKDKHLADNYIYVDNLDLTVDYFINYALKNHKFGIEGQTLVVIDEAQIIFNSRDWNTKGSNRMEWLKFFSQHRKFGFNIILIAQYDRMLDRQIRSLVEYEIAHMKMNNFFFMLPFTAFLAVTRWYGQKMKVSSEIIVYKKKHSKYYNSYKFFESLSSELCAEWTSKG